jgi:hypothetical protein
MRYWLIRKLLGRQANIVVWSLRETQQAAGPQYGPKLYALAERLVG